MATMANTVGPWLSAHHLWLHRETAHQPVPASPRLEPHERALARETSSDGTQCVATDQAIYTRPPGAARQWSRLAWEAVEQVGWERSTHILNLLAGTDQVRLHLAARSRLGGLAAERVGAAHVLHRRVRLNPSCAATVDAVHDASGGVTWRVSYDASCDIGDPAVTTAMAEALHQVRAQAGC